MVLTRFYGLRAPGTKGDERQETRAMEWWDSGWDRMDFCVSEMERVWRSGRRSSFRFRY